MAIKGIKSKRGIPEKYNEIKSSVCYSLTPTAKQRLKIMAAQNEMCPSEFLECIARGKYLIIANRDDNFR